MIFPKFQHIFARYLTSQIKDLLIKEYALLKYFVRTLPGHQGKP